MKRFLAWRRGKRWTRVKTPAATKVRQDIKWAENFLALREEKCREQIEGDGSIGTKDSVLDSKTESRLLNFFLGKDTACFVIRTDIN